MPRRMSTRILLVVVLLAACDRSAEPEAAPATPPATSPLPMPEPSANEPPLAPAADMFTSADGLVAAPRPSGDGWECVEQTASEPGNEATLIKCRHTDSERFFFLMAKDYAVPADQVRSAEELAAHVFPTTYQKLFQSHEVRESKAVDHAGKPAYELRIEAVHASMGPIRKHERVITQGNHVFVLSAEGKPEVFDGEAAAIAAWFSGARFKNLP